MTTMINDSKIPYTHGGHTFDINLSQILVDGGIDIFRLKSTSPIDGYEYTTCGEVKRTSLYGLMHKHAVNFYKELEVHDE